MRATAHTITPSTTRSISGITLDTDSVTVKVQNARERRYGSKTETTVAATSYTKNHEDNALTVTINDLKTIKDENGNAITVAPVRL